MKKIVLIGYGSQARSWGQNLRDSGWSVSILLRENSPSQQTCHETGFQTLILKKGIEKILLSENPKPLLACLIPDHIVPDFFQEHRPLFESIEKGTLVFAHGYAPHFLKASLPQHLDWILVAPKAIGPAVRKLYLEKKSLAGALAVKDPTNENSWKQAKLLATDLGIQTHQFKTTFKDGTLADLFSEQVLLCGGIPRLLQTAYQFLIDQGVNPKLAYYECVQELKLIVDLIVEDGIQGMFQKISPTALFGSVSTSKTFLPTENLKENMASIWKHLESGAFTQEFDTEKETQFKNLVSFKKSLANSPLEKIWAELENPK